MRDLKLFLCGSPSFPSKQIFFTIQTNFCYLFRLVKNGKYNFLEIPALKYWQLNWHMRSHLHKLQRPYSSTESFVNNISVKAPGGFDRCTLRSVILAPCIWIEHSYQWHMFVQGRPTFVHAFFFCPAFV